MVFGMYVARTCRACIIGLLGVVGVLHIMYLPFFKATVIILSQKIHTTNVGRGDKISLSSDDMTCIGIRNDTGHGKPVCR